MSFSLETKLGITPYAWLTIFLFIPLLCLFGISFLSSGAPGDLPLTYNNYSVITEGYFLKPLFRSILYAGISTVLSICLAIPLAVWISGLGRYKNIFLFLVILPFWTNFLIRMYGWKMIFRENGVIDKLLSVFLVGENSSILGTPAAIVIGLLYFYLPLMVLPLYVAVENFDWRIALAAKDLGAGVWKIFCNIFIPLIAPAIKTGSLFVFVLSFGDFVVSDILGGAKNAMIGNSIRDAFLLSRNWPQGAAMTILITLLAILTSLTFKSLKGKINR